MIFINKEFEMYNPIKQYFCNCGYEVKSEINHIDVVAIKNEHKIAFEMKVTFNDKLISQCINRQKYFDDVYMVLPYQSTIKSKRENIEIIAKRLNLGLIFIHKRQSEFMVEVVVVPDFGIYRLDKHLQNKFLNEFYSRHFDLNVGGISRNKIASAYREDSINIATLLKINNKPLKVKDIILLSGVDKAQSILLKNHYKMFKRVRRGFYTFNFNDEEALKSFNSFPKLCEFYEKKYSHNYE